MSVFSALDTALSGLTAQSVAFSNIGNNIANSQTIGYKAVDTSFSDYVETSGALEGQSGNVLAKTQYSNQDPGSVTASTANAALAVNGSGFFAVNEVSGVSTATTPSFSTTQYYTRAGDFQSDRNGYLVNSAGEYLDGYAATTTSSGTATTTTVGTTLAPINVNNIKYIPTATSNVNITPTLQDNSAILASNAAGAAAAAADGTTFTPATLPAQTSTETVYDTEGAAHVLTMNWTQTAGATANPSTGATYNLEVSSPGGTTTNATVTFNADNTLQSIVPVSPATATAAGATLNIGTVGADTNTINLNLGTIGAANGSITSGSTTAFAAGSPTQDGTSSGNYTGFTTQTDGSIIAQFDNGQSQLIAKVPVATFANANALLAQDGQAYTATIGSGPSTIQYAGTNNAGSLETNSVEGSTTSLDSDLTKLIVAQQAYGASAKVVTTANSMLQTALGMVQ